MGVSPPFVSALTAEGPNECTGGHALGSASDVLYEPDGLVKLAAADGLPLVYVGINYRLGCTSFTRVHGIVRTGCGLLTNSSLVFGFATGEAFIERKDTNAGLRDQRAALECMYLGALRSHHETLKHRGTRGS